MNNQLIADIVSFLQTVPKFSTLPLETLKEISNTVEVMQLQAGEVLNQDSEISYLYIIFNGIIQQNNHDRGLRSKLSNEDIFGFNLKFEPSAQTYSIIAIENTLLYRFNYFSLVQKLEGYPNILSQLDLSLATSLKASVTESDNSQQSLHQYMRPCSDVMSCKFVLASVHDTIQSVASQMRHIKTISCAFIVAQDHRLIGLVTDKDITQRVVADALDVQQPIGSVMTANPYTIYGNELVMEAVQLMTKYNIQNIPVVDNKHHVVGYITPKDLIQNSGALSVYLVNKIRHASSLQQLIALSHQRNAAFKEVMESTSYPNLVAQILTTIYDAFNRRLIELAIENHGTPPCAFSWIVAGSHARNEVHLASDQDNALILDDKSTKSDRIYFNHLAMTVCKGLSELGYSLCKGRFMAATTKWCQTSQIWREYFKLWSENPEYESLLNLNVFIEIRHIYGDKLLFQEVDAHRHQQIIHNHPLTVALVRNALRTRPPLGIFQNLVLEKDANNNRVLNIKKAAITCLVDLVRINAIINNCRAINTNDRIKYLYQEKVFNKATYQDLIGTYQYLTHLRYQHQQQAIESNNEINNLLKPNVFGSFERRHLKDSFRIIYTFQNLLKIKFIK